MDIEYKAGQRLYEYRVDLYPYPDETPEPAALYVWNVTRVVRKGGVLRVHLALDGKEHIKHNFSIYEGQLTRLHDSFCETKRAAYAVGRKKIRAAAKRLDRMLKALEGLDKAALSEEHRAAVKLRKAAAQASAKKLRESAERCPVCGKLHVSVTCASWPKVPKARAEL